MQKIIPYLQIAISICCALFFVVPMYYSFHIVGIINDDMSDGEMSWVKQYFYDDKSVALLVLPFFLIWAIYLFTKNRTKTFKIPLLLSMFGLTIIHSFAGYHLINKLTFLREFSATWGTLLLFIPAPIVLLLLICEWKAPTPKQKQIQVFDEKILDE